MSNILIISFNIPYPPNHGGAISQLFFLEKMVNKYHVTFLTRAANSFQEEKVRRLAQYLPELNVVCYRPLKKKEKTFLQKLNSKILNRLNSKKTRPLNTFKFDLPDKNFLNFLNSTLSEVDYDIIQLEFFETLNIIPFLPSEKKIIYICHEINSRAKDEGGISNNYDNIKTSFLRSIEINLLNRFNKIVIFNKNDEVYLNNLSSIYYSPYGIMPSLIKKYKISRKFEKLIFLGADNHLPNRDGLLWFLDSIYIPNYDEIEMPILVFSNWSKTAQLKYKTYQKIKFLGNQKNIENFYDNSILITPIRTGTGLRTKILNAFANKIPVMSTALAAEGLFTAEESEHIIFFENSREFLDKIKKVKIDEEYPKSVAMLAHSYYSEKFSSSRLLKLRFNIYEMLEDDQ